MSIGYEPDTATLEIEFTQSGIYQYFGVPAQIYEELMAAGSKGNYFNHQIKTGGYQFTKVG